MTTSNEAFTATLKMAANAGRGLKLRKKFKRGGTAVGVRRAHQLAERRALDARGVKSMSSYFARHAVDRQGQAHEWGGSTDPSAGHIAWLLWGGDEGKVWADRKRATLD